MRTRIRKLTRRGSFERREIITDMTIYCRRLSPWLSRSCILSVESASVEGRQSDLGWNGGHRIPRLDSESSCLFLLDAEAGPGPVAMSLMLDMLTGARRLNIHARPQAMQAALLTAHNTTQSVINLISEIN